MWTPAFELLIHQRFPIRTLENAGFRGLRPPPNRLAVNFIPARLTLDFGAVRATAAYTKQRSSGSLRTVLHRLGDELSEHGRLGRTVRDHWSLELVTRLGRVLEVMAADPGRRLSGIDVL